jgi:voltage-gated potassium channel
VLRLFRFLKIIRYSPAMQVIAKVFYKEGRALFASLMIMLALLLFASTGMHYIEGNVQPETFGDIPSAMWWALATLTTVGYGDAVPVTTLGKLWSSLFMVFGLGMFALPIGIISTGFAQEINRREFVINWNMVARVPLFNRLEASQVAEIMGLLHSQRFPKDIVIFEKGKEATGMYFIVSGNVELFNGTDSVVIEPGAFFGEAGLLSSGGYNVTAKALTNCHLLQLDRDDFEYLLRKNKDMNQHIREVATARMSGEWEIDGMP